MPTDSFRITTGSNTIALNNRQTGKASFSVTNVSGRQLDHVRLAIVIPEPTARSWFTVDGDEEREFGVGALQQVTVRLAVPPDAPSAQYTFRLRAIDLENPDEAYSDSPAVTFAVPEAPEKPKGLPLLWIGLAVAALLILVFGAALIYLLLRDNAPEIATASFELVPTGGMVGTSIEVVDSSTGTIDTRLLTATNLLTGDKHELRLEDSLFSIENAGIYQIVLAVSNEEGSSEAERTLILAPNPGEDVELTVWSSWEDYPLESAFQAWANTYPQDFSVDSTVVSDSSDLERAFEEGEPPDLASIHARDFPDLYARIQRWPPDETVFRWQFTEEVIGYLEKQDSHELPYQFPDNGNVIGVPDGEHYWIIPAGIRHPQQAVLFSIWLSLHSAE